MGSSKSDFGPRGELLGKYGSQMPNLLIFAPCEKIVMDKEGNASLIVLFENLTVDSKEQAEIPRNAVSPKEWAVFTRWQMNEDEKERPFVQCILVRWPDGSEFNKGAVQFPSLPVSTIKQVTLSIMGFPVGQEGPIKIILWLELDSKRVTDEYACTLNVLHKKKAT